jgi:hypothetical protein
VGRDSSRSRIAPAHDLRDLVVGETAGEQLVGDLDHPGHVERHLDRAVEVRTEPDVVHSGHVRGVADGARDRDGIVAARSRGPEPDPDQAARPGDPAQVLVGQVAGVVGHSPDPGVRGDDRPGRAGQDVADRGGRRVRHVDQHPALLHPLDHLVTGRREAALDDPVRGSAERVVEEVGRRHHPEARVGNDLDVGRVAVQRVRALDGQQAGGHRPARGPGGEMRLEVRARPDDRQSTGGPADRKSVV